MTQNTDRYTICTDFTEECRYFFTERVFPALEQRFPDVLLRLAAGIAGEGSECYGYDDGISKDHDFAVSLCIWLTDQDYDRTGAAMQEMYEQLVTDAVSGGAYTVSCVVIENH